MSWYWLIVVVAVLVVLHPFQGWITWLVHQRRRERRFAVVSPVRVLQSDGTASRVDR